MASKPTAASLKEAQPAASRIAPYFGKATVPATVKPISAGRKGLASKNPK
jgi:hypothetical protein